MVTSSLRIKLFFTIFLGAFLWSGHEVGAVSTSANLVSFIASDCIIPAGSSTCASTIYITPYSSGKSYTLYNMARNITSNNFITGNNLGTIPGSNTSAFTIGVGLSTQVANYLTYGGNGMELRDGTVVIGETNAAATCASGTKWNGTICTTVTPNSSSGTTGSSKVSLSTGNGDTSYSSDLFSQISKNVYYPENVSKNISIPTTTSILNISLSSTKEQCFIVPNYIAESGTSFSNNSSLIKKIDLGKSVTVPTSSYTEQVGGILYGKISKLALSCDNKVETVKDFLIYNINPSSKVEPTSIQFKTQNCIISVGNSTCASTITLSAPSGKSYSVKNVTRNVTSTNLLTSNNYVSIAGASPVYTVTSSSLSDAANYARNGTNDLTVYEGLNSSTILARASMVASCASGSSWNGTICASSTSTVDTLSEVVTCNFSNSTSNQKCSTTSEGVIYSCSGIKSCSVRVYGKRGTTMTWISSLSGTNKTTVDNQDETITFGNQGSVLPIACTNDMRYCPDGAPMPRSQTSCEWLPGQCSPTPIGTSPPTSVVTLQKYRTNAGIFNFTANQIIKFNPAVDTILILQGVAPKNATSVELHIGDTVIGETWVGSNGEWELGNIMTSGFKDGFATYKIVDNAGGSTSIRIQVIRDTTTPPAANSDVTIEAKDCTIAIGKSMCASTVSVTSMKYKGTTGGRTFDLRNTTRNVLSSNLFTPNVTTLNSAGYPVYTVSVHPDGNTANYATNGKNELSLIEGGTVVAKVTMTATCATGSSWNGTICANSTNLTPPVKEVVTCNFSNSTSTQKCSATSEGVIYSCSGIKSCSVTVSGKKYATLTWESTLGGKQSTTIDNQNETITFSNQGGIVPIACTDVMRYCADGTPMPRGNNSCDWLPEKCSPYVDYPIEIDYPINPVDIYYPIDPIIPNFVPAILVDTIGGTSLNGDDAISITKSPTEILTVSGKITPKKSGLSIKLTSNTSSYYIYMPVSSSGLWGTTQSTTADLYKSKLVAEGENLLTFSLIEESTNKVIKQKLIKLQVAPPTQSSNVINPNGGSMTPKPSDDTVIPTCSTPGSCTTNAGSQDLLDDASRKRIDTIIARTKVRVATMSPSNAVSFLNTSIKRIQSLPNKNDKAKLIDTYTIIRLELLRDAIQSTQSTSEEDYISLVDTVLSN